MPAELAAVVRDLRAIDAALRPGGISSGEAAAENPENGGAPAEETPAPAPETVS